MEQEKRKEKKRKKKKEKKRREKGRKEKRLIGSNRRLQINKRRRSNVTHSKRYGRISEYVSKSGTEWKDQVLFRDLPLTFKERHRLLDYTKSFLPLWIGVLQYSIDVSIVMGGFLLVSHLMKRK